jgi:formylglycine-generating enzyme required for sulfatase activity/tRNA A-37 threonylcarbamoyl transferase component Bud32
MPDKPCPTREELAALVLGTLPEEAVEPVATHLEACPHCEQLARALDEEAGRDPVHVALRQPPDDATRHDVDATRISAPQQAASGQAANVPCPGTAGPTHFLADYEVLEEVGSGGMGQVFKARHATMGRTVALKTLSKQLLTSRTATERLRREVQAAARLVHPNIVLAHDAGQHDGTPFLVMEYIDGQDLASLVRARGPLPVAEAVGYAVQAARGLGHAHHHGVIHRDIKPANLMVDRQGTVKVLDLGLVRLSAAFGDVSQLDSSRLTGSGRTAGRGSHQGGSLTEAGDVMGSAPYMAPEQTRSSHAVDPRADVYSLGCTLYYMLAGRPPFKGKTLAETVLAHRDAPPPPLRDVRPDVPHKLDAVYQRMLAKDPGRRQASMDEVAADLAACLPAHRKRWHRLAWVAAGLAAFLLLGFGVFRVLSPRPAGPHGGAGDGVFTLPFSADQARERQRRCADDLGLPVVHVNSLGMKLVLIPPGEFEPAPGYRAQIKHAFYLGAHEVTVGQFRAFVEATGHRTDAERHGGFVPRAPGAADLVLRRDASWRRRGVEQTDDDPVVQVSWNDAERFCAWLAGREGKTYRTPTEARWEWAVRAGTASAGGSAPDEAKPAGMAATAENTRARMRPVGRLRPNAWGLYDVQGIVAEWCRDYYTDKLPGGTYSNPQGPAAGTSRVWRGSSFRTPAREGWHVRGHGAPDAAYCDVGFRVYCKAWVARPTDDAAGTAAK